MGPALQHGGRMLDTENTEDTAKAYSENCSVFSVFSVFSVSHAVFLVVVDRSSVVNLNLPP